MPSGHEILIAGTGSIGERHVRCFQATGRAKISICEVDLGRREAVARDYQVERTFSDYEAALASRPSAVVIAVPAHLHLAMASMAIERRLPVLIEKPLATYSECPGDLLKLARESHVTVAVAYVYRFHPALIAMREAIHSGRFGRPLQVVAVTGQHFPYYRPAFASTYYARHETGGGAVQDALTHVVDAVSWLVGMPSEVIADIAHKALPGVEVEDTVHVLARHGEVLGCYSLNQHQAPNEFTLTVVCSEGTARFEYHQNRWRWMVSPDSAWCDEASPALSRDTVFTHQADHFLSTVEGIHVPRCSLEEAVVMQQASKAILLSSETKTWQSISYIYRPDW